MEGFCVEERKGGVVVDKEEVGIHLQRPHLLQRLPPPGLIHPSPWIHSHTLNQARIFQLSILKYY